MNHSRDSSVSSSDRNYDKEYLKFIVERLKKTGRLRLQNLAGHLSLLDPEIRNAVGSSKANLMKFLRRYSDTFSISEEGTVTLLNSGLVSDKQDAINNKSAASFENAYPNELKNGLGVITNLNLNYGTLKVSHPISTTVCFTASNFGNSEKSNLSEFNLKISQKLGFDAKKNLSSSYDSAYYSATKVWIQEENSAAKKKYYFTPKKRNKIENGLYDANCFEGEGYIQKIFETYGFIAIENDKANTVFFHANRISNCKNITDLRKVLKVNDVVEFYALRSTKTDSQARWMATQVWLKKEIKASSSDDDIFVSGNEASPSQSDGEDVKNELQCKKTIQQSKYATFQGKIYPRGSHSAVIKFGEGNKELADATDCAFYFCGNETKDIMWEFTDGDKVSFDAIQTDTLPRWKAVLVWVGAKPINYSANTHNHAPESKIDSIKNHKSKSAELLSEISPSENAFKNWADTPFPAEESLVNEMGPANKNSGRKSNNETYAKDITKKAPKNIEDVINSSKKSDEKEDFSCVFTETNNIANSKKELNDKNPSLSCNFTDGNNIANSKKQLKDKNPSDDHDTDKKRFLSCKFTEGNTASSKKRPEDQNPSDNYDVDKKRVLSSGFTEGNNIVNNKKQLESKNPSGNCDDEKKALSCDFTEVNNNTVNNKEELEEENVLANYKGDAKKAFSCEFTEANNVVNSKKQLNDNASFNYEPSCSLSEISKDFQPTDLKIKSSVTVYSNMVGKIENLYDAYGVISCSKFAESFSFSWESIYCDGVPIKGKYFSLKDKFKVGEKINFNCFEIVDCDDYHWMVLTVGWKGEKPKKVKEIDPKKYIIENDIDMGSDDFITNRVINRTECFENVVTNKEKPAVSGEKMAENSSQVNKSHNVKETNQFSSFNIESMRVLNSNQSDEKMAGDSSQVDKSLNVKEINQFSNFNIESMRVLNSNQSASYTSDAASNTESMSLCTKNQLVNNTKTFPEDQLNSSNDDSLSLCVDSVFEFLSFIFQDTRTNHFSDTDLQDHLKNVSKGIVDLVQHHLQSSFETKNEPKHLLTHNRKKTIDKAVQTFITGEVYSSLIFPH